MCAYFLRMLGRIELRLRLVVQITRPFISAETALPSELAIIHFRDEGRVHHKVTKTTTRQRDS